jgi:very-long-chain (3R)-3-hydroxyacyl-CoA dehydratase
MILYPSGISGEIWTVVAGLPHLKKTGLYSISMPNAWNFEFNFYWFVILVLVTYIPGSPFMYSHMWKQRSKTLGKAKAEAGVEQKRKQN